MNENVRIITDSGCDISPESEKEWSKYLVIMPFAMTFKNKTKLDRVEIQPDEFYKILKENEEIPKHSPITQSQFEDKFRELYSEGVREIIIDVINAAGSKTHSNAKSAAENISSELSDLKVHLVDSRSYTLGYGYPILEACKKLAEGKSVRTVVEFLEDWTRHTEAFIIGFELRHMKKSRRISAVSSFIGELMGIKPMIMLYDSINEIAHKARGESAAIEESVNIISERMLPQTPYCVITTTIPELEKEFIDKITEKVGYPPAMVEKCGVVVSCNAGPEFIGVIIKGQERD